MKLLLHTGVASFVIHLGALNDDKSTSVCASTCDAPRVDSLSTCLSRASSYDYKVEKERIDAHLYAITPPDTSNLQHPESVQNFTSWGADAS